MVDGESGPGGDDNRHNLYSDLHGRQLTGEEEDNHYSAARILTILFGYYRPQSVLDVGCGIGSWLRAASELGVCDVAGIEGHWLDRGLLQVSPEFVQACDLERGFDLNRRFDLTISLEVAEHLSHDSAPGFVASLVRHAPAVLFSAAIPLQGGHHHVNEQFLTYWVELFAHHDYRPLDFIRGEIWDNPNILWWLRQNIMFFAHDSVIAGNDKLLAVAASHGPLSVVHPSVYLMNELKRIEYDRLTELLRRGGLFQVTLDGRGGFQLNKVD